MPEVKRGWLDIAGFGGSGHTDTRVLRVNPSLNLGASIPPNVSPNRDLKSDEAVVTRAIMSKKGSVFAEYPVPRIVCPALNLDPPDTRPGLHSDSVAHFASVPWCAALLQAPGAVVFTPSCRNPEGQTDSQALGTTLATERTVPHMLSCFVPADAVHVRDPARPITRVQTFFTARDGISGYPGVVQGGMVMAIMDEALGVLMEINMGLGKEGAAFQTNCVTASMDIKFLKPVPTSDICATAWIESIEGRKVKISCIMSDETGEELAKATSLWLALRPNM
ncbi:Verlamelin biosynthesis protein B [Paramyrothecium foliicola]|nr:Verlamelin biosynthesis protein B [Paramyrothecium foliicola]